MLSTTLVYLAIVLATLVAVQLASTIMVSLRRLAAYGIRQRMEAELFNGKIELARLQLKRQQNHAPWSGARKFMIQCVVEECRDVRSFYLVPHDKKPLPSFLPGQYLTFELDIPGQRNRVVRCYSLSDRPRPDFYRVTIKRIPASPKDPNSKPGLASNYFHGSLKEGDIVDVKAPGGGFHLDLSRTTPVVLIGGGIGLTPVLSMLNEIVESGTRRETWFFFAARNSSEHMMKAHVEAVARDNPYVHLHVCYSRPDANDVAGQDFQHEGRLNLELLKEVLPSNNFDFYLCGPGEMMSGTNEALLSWGVHAAKIHMEAFGPASVKKPPASADASVPKPAAISVAFSRSGKTANWTGEADSLLDFALAENIAIGFGCRAGSCGTCKTAIKSGKVKYLKEPGCDVEAGSCLTCICIPAEGLVLEA
jgi:ferredoxin-NADP reductase